MKDWEWLVYLALLVVKNVPPLTPLYLFVININILNAYPLFLVVSPGWFVLVILVLLLVS